MKDKHGVNVHTSYITQVKRMSGLDMDENYNKSKKEYPEVKQCPQEKVEYIKDALMHLKIILVRCNMEEKQMQEIFYELYNEFVKRAEEKNKGIRIKFMHSQIGFSSKEMISFVVSECLMEDVETIYKLKTQGFSDRYTDFVIRNMCEQVIEYIYIMRHPELIPEYFGENIKDEWNGTNLFNGLKRTGGARFKERKSVSEMSVDIGEKVSDDEKVSLYDIYSLKAEFEHHSYFNHMLNTICYENDENESADEMDYMYLVYVLTAFIKTYDTF